MRNSSRLFVDPAERNGKRVDDQLARRILQDMETEAFQDHSIGAYRIPDQLPLLQHAMALLWDRRDLDGDESDLSVIDYERLADALRAEVRPPEFGESGVQIEWANGPTVLSTVLSAHADALFYQLKDGRDRRAARRVFLLLTDFRSNDRLDVRRARTLRELLLLANLEGGYAQFMRIATIFASASSRLLLLTEDGQILDPDEVKQLSDNTVVDICHESLLRHWGRFKDWIRAERRSIDECRAIYTGMDARAGKKGKIISYTDPDEVTGHKDWLAVELSRSDTNRIADWVEEKQDLGQFHEAWFDPYFDDLVGQVRNISTSHVSNKTLFARIERTAAENTDRLNRRRRSTFMGIAILLLAIGGFVAANYYEVERERYRLATDRAESKISAGLEEIGLIEFFEDAPSFYSNLRAAEETQETVYRSILPKLDLIDPIVKVAAPENKTRGLTPVAIHSFVDEGGHRLRIAKVDGDFREKLKITDEGGRDTKSEKVEIAFEGGLLHPLGEAALMVDGERRRIAFWDPSRTWTDTIGIRTDAIRDIGIVLNDQQDPRAVMLSEENGRCRLNIVSTTASGIEVASPIPLGVCQSEGLLFGNQDQKLSSESDPQVPLRWGSTQHFQGLKFVGQGVSSYTLIQTVNTEGQPETQSVKFGAGFDSGTPLTGYIPPIGNATARSRFNDTEGIAFIVLASEIKPDDDGVAGYVANIFNLNGDLPHNFHEGNSPVVGASIRSIPPSLVEEGNTDRYAAAVFDADSVVSFSFMGEESGRRQMQSVNAIAVGPHVLDIDPMSSPADPIVPRMLYIANGSSVERLSMDRKTAVCHSPTIASIEDEFFECADILTWAQVKEQLEKLNEDTHRHFDTSRPWTVHNLALSRQGYRMASVWRSPNQHEADIVVRLRVNGEGRLRDLLVYQSEQCYRYAEVGFDLAEKRISSTLSRVLYGDDNVLAAYCSEIKSETSKPKEYSSAIEYFVAQETSNPFVMPWNFNSPPDHFFAVDGTFAFESRELTGDRHSLRVGGLPDDGQEESLVRISISEEKSIFSSEQEIENVAISNEYVAAYSLNSAAEPEVKIWPYSELAPVDPIEDLRNEEQTYWRKEKNAWSELAHFEFVGENQDLLFALTRDGRAAGWRRQTVNGQSELAWVPIQGSERESPVSSGGKIKAVSQVAIDPSRSSSTGTLTLEGIVRTVWDNGEIIDYEYGDAYWGDHAIDGITRDAGCLEKETNPTSVVAVALDSEKVVCVVRRSGNSEESLVIIEPDAKGTVPIFAKGCKLPGQEEMTPFRNIDALSISSDGRKILIGHIGKPPLEVSVGANNVVTCQQLESLGTPPIPGTQVLDYAKDDRIALTIIRDRLSIYARDPSSEAFISKPVFSKELEGAFRAPPTLGLSTLLQMSLECRSFT